MGLAYKKNSGDARETPSTDVIRHLLRLGATVTAHNPYVGEYELDDEVSRTELTAAALEAADVVVLVTDHDCFDDDLISNRSAYLFDTRLRLPPFSSARTSAQNRNAWTIPTTGSPEPRWRPDQVRGSACPGEGLARTSADGSLRLFG